MKFLFTLLLIGGNAFAFTMPSRTECKNLLDALNANLTDVQGHFAEGTAARFEVDAAQLAVLNAALRCGDITRGQAEMVGTYCSQANIDTLTEYVKGIQDVARVGEKTSADVTQALEVQAKMLGICE